MARFSVAVVGLFELLVAMLFAFYTLSPLIDKATLPFFGSHATDSAIFGIAMCCMLVLAIGLIRHSKLAWWISIIGSGILAIFGISLIWLSLHPRDAFAASEGGFGISLGGLLFLPGALSLALLSVPKTHQYFFHLSKPQN